MRLCPLFLALGVVACGADEAPNDTGAGAGAEAQLVAAERAWARAMATRDSSGLERLMAGDVVLVVGGESVPRAAWVSNTLERFRMDSVGLFHVSPEVHGDSASVALELYWKATSTASLAPTRRPCSGTPGDTRPGSGGWPAARCSHGVRVTRRRRNRSRPGNRAAGRSSRRPAERIGIIFEGYGFRSVRA